MDIKRMQKFCKFTAYYNTTFLFVITATSAMSIGIAYGIELVFLSTGEILALLALLVTLIVQITLTVVFVYVIKGIDYLFEEKKRKDSDFTLQMIFHACLGLFTLIVCIVLNIVGIFNWIIDILYAIALCVTLTLNFTAFSMKKKLNKALADEEKEKKERTHTGSVTIDQSIFFENSKGYSPYGQIRAIEGEYQGAVFKVKSGEKLIFGKDARCCHVVLKSKSISRQHCEVRFDGEKNEYVIVDYSTNGTFWLNGKKLPQKMRCKCRPGTIFTMDHQKQMFQLI